MGLVVKQVQLIGSGEAASPTTCIQFEKTV
jgi:hypothetical protein